MPVDPQGEGGRYPIFIGTWEAISAVSKPILQINTYRPCSIFKIYKICTVAPLETQKMCQMSSHLPDFHENFLFFVIFPYTIGILQVFQETAKI